MDIKKSGSQPSAKGSAEYFTGTVRIDPLFQAYDRLLKSDVKYRFVIDMASLKSE
ncbi:hypothetical protein [Nostoc sp. ChiSLP03a]|uniref:hypothetical protein n=1 Tax=Nostoc sp. ChiSLP03a TaxID=3075380 RepID=UPI002AD2668E|nr:hypothetical protein [Nostoc sp. ChiSLP03a]MDZ8211254.1 hypothetical protein [Nostoc sp. ChiSLP03a]